MIQLPETSLFIGGIIALQQTHDQDWAFVHATQTIHYRFFGWNRSTNKPDKYHPHYIIYEKDNMLSLNWVDGAAHLYNWSGVSTFNKVLDFIERWHQEKNVLIHCDQGQSRAPTIGLLFLAKRLKSIPGDSFESAKDAFVKIYPNYLPGGIGDYVRQKWEEF